MSLDPKYFQKLTQEAKRHHAVREAEILAETIKNRVNEIIASAPVVMETACKERKSSAIIFDLATHIEKYSDLSAEFRGTVEKLIEHFKQLGFGAKQTHYGQDDQYSYGVEISWDENAHL